jgi:hypothetical protein
LGGSGGSGSGVLAVQGFTGPGFGNSRSARGGSGIRPNRSVFSQLKEDTHEQDRGPPADREAASAG